MRRNVPDTLVLAIATLALVLLFGGAPLAIAIPGGALIWLLSLRVKKASACLPAALGALLVAYPAYIALIQVSYWRAGQQGVDFGIFSQVIHQVAERDLFITSLISTEWQNFITHHFSPFLLVLGWVAKAGVSSEAALIGAHTVSVMCLVWGVQRLVGCAGTRTQALVVSATILLLPGVRRALGWETHDEVLALPFIVWSLVAHYRGRELLALLLLFPPLLFKETFGLVMCATALAYFVDRTSHSNNHSTSTKILALSVAMFGALFFVMVSLIFPGWLWISTFNISSRVATLGDMVSLELLRAKIRWLLVTFVPMVPFLFLHTRGTLRGALVLASPALPSLAAIVVTNFPPMLDPYNYYSITPALVILIAVSLPVLRHPTVSWAILASLCLTLICGGTVRSAKLVRAGFAAQSAYAELRAVVPNDSAVVVDDYTASVLAKNSYVQRIIHARRSRASFDYIVVLKSLSAPLPEGLVQKSVECHETLRYVIRCRKE